jgi:hypothetical protein
MKLPPRRPPARAGRFRPCLEPLESRSLLAVTFNAPSGTAPPGGALVVTGDNAADVVALVDTGLPAGGPSYRVGVNGLQFVFNDVASVLVDLGDGNDRVDYTVLQERDLTYFAFRQVVVDLGAGNDRMNAALNNANFNGGAAPAGLGFQVEAGDGNDLVQFQGAFTLTGAGSAVTALARTGNGADVFNGSLTPAWRGADAAVRLNADLGLGNDAANVSVRGAIPATGDLRVGVTAGPDAVGPRQRDNDTVSLSYAGVNNGVLVYSSVGGAGRDSLFYQVQQDAASLGRAVLTSLGGRDDDRLRLDATAPSAAGVTAQANGGRGFNRVFFASLIDPANLASFQVKRRI